MKNISDMDLLSLMFIYLKLTNQIEWSWFFVLLPEILKFGIICCQEIKKIF